LCQFGLCALEVALQRPDQLADIAATAGQGSAQLFLKIACGRTRVAAHILAQLAERILCRLKRLG
jgi:hypothetical protein